MRALPIAILCALVGACDGAEALDGGGPDSTPLDQDVGAAFDVGAGLDGALPETDVGAVLDAAAPMGLRVVGGLSSSEGLPLAGRLRLVDHGFEWPTASCRGSLCVVGGFARPR